MSDPLTYRSPRVQQLRRLLRRRSARLDDGLFVVEGPTLIGEAVRAGWQVSAEFVASGVAPTSGAPVFVLADGVMERVSATETPPGAMALVERPVVHDAGPMIESATFVLVAHRIADPGNLGTMIRSAEAAGVDLVVVTEGTTDAFGPKAVRASAGAIFHVPIVEADLDRLVGAGYRLLATSSHRGTDHRAAEYSGRVALVTGNEAHGLEADSGAAPVWPPGQPTWITIRQHGRSESLNAAMATTLVLFEAAARRAGV